MTRIRVVVTADHIALGERMSQNSCPIALALRPRFPDARVYRTWWMPEVPSVAYDTSEGASRFVAAFDAGDAVQPATFYLEGPDR